METTNNYNEVWEDAIHGTMWRFSRIGSQIKTILDDVELIPLLYKLPELGKLVSMLKCIPWDYDMEKFDAKITALEKKKPSKRTAEECRGIEPLEFLYLTYLMIEAYDNLCEEAVFIPGLPRPSWDKLLHAYDDAVYAVLFCVSDEIADIWKEQKFRALGYIERFIEGLR